MVKLSVASFKDHKHEKYKRKVVSVLILACRGSAMGEQHINQDMKQREYENKTV